MSLDSEILNEIEQFYDNPHIESDNIDHWLNFFKYKKNWFSLLMHPKKPRKIVFYGFSMEIFTTLNELIYKWKVDPNNIMLILPDSFVTMKKFDNNEEKLDFDEKLVDNP